MISPINYSICVMLGIIYHITNQLQSMRDVENDI